MQVSPFLYLRDKLIQSSNDRERFSNYRYKRQDSPSAQYTGNGRFEGYIMELLTRISDVIRGIDFEYEVELVADGKFGASGDYNAIWDGMVGEVVRGTADVAAAPLTVTWSRKEAVEFTYPFMSSGIQTLVLHPDHIKHDPFRIIYPFTIEVWFVNLFLFCIVALMIYIFNKWDPYEWKAVAEKGMTHEENAKNFNLKNSLWFCATTLFLQSSDCSPRSNAGRCIAGFWWLFVLAMVFLYVTNLMFFVNSNRRLAGTQSPNDLLSQTQIKYGTIGDGNTNHYLEVSLPSFWHEMNNDPDGVYVSDISEGVKRVRSSNGFYAYLGESRELDWIAKQKPCEFEVVGEYIARTQYAFAVAKDSPLVGHISGAIETLRENGILEDMERDWWHLDDTNNYCSNLTQFERSGAFSITVNDISGAYYMLLIGIGASILVFLGELLFWGLIDVQNTRPDKKSLTKSQENKAEPKRATGANMWI